MLSRRLLTICALAAGFSGYMFLLEDNRNFALPLGIAIGLGIMVYVFHYQLNWWWSKKFPPRLDASMVAMYEKACAFYRDLTAEDKEKFGTRAALFVASKEFIGMGRDKVAEDLKYMVASYAVMLTFHQEEFMFKGYDRIVFYLHPFLSPNHPDDVHSCEVEHTDGTVILSIEHLTASFLSPGAYYQVGLHALAEAYKGCYLTRPVAFDDDIWNRLESAGGTTHEEINAFIGLEQDDPWPVAVHHWFVHRQAFNAHLPQLGEDLGHVFKHDQTS